ncbi:MAG: aldo/keto reductase [Myxococcota bacterium]
MIYRELGRTGEKVSRLGLGAMRLKLLPSQKLSEIDVGETERLVNYCYEQGINYFDTAWMYHGGESERVVGRLIKPFRKEIYLSTKSPGYKIKKRGDFRRIFEEQLKKLETDYLDFYFLHGISWESSEEVRRRDDWFEGIQKLKEEGLVKHICFSFHGEEGDIERLVDTGIFEAMLVQYNILDRKNRRAMKYAKEKGLGVLVMSPVGGGRIADFSAATMEKFGFDHRKRVELAFRFVFANCDVDCALSGMSTAEMARENIGYLMNTEPLSSEEGEGIERVAGELEKLAGLYCTGCNYCMPCPEEVNIPEIFAQVNNYRIYGMRDYARKQYSDIGVHPWMPGAKADMCTSCGECLEKCPQKLDIPDELKKAREMLEN